MVKKVNEKINVNSEEDADMKAWFNNKDPLLKVLVSYPARPGERIHEPHVFLNMEQCLRTIDQEDILRAVVEGLKDSRTDPEQGDAREPPRKKRRS